MVFPELSLTGYDLDAEPVDPDDPALLPLVEACVAAGAVAWWVLLRGRAEAEHVATLRGRPGRGGGRLPQDATSGRPSTERFTPGPGALVVDVDGHRVGLGICKDTGVAAHVRDVAALGVDLYVAGLVHHPEELAEQRARAVDHRPATGAPVAFASSPGRTVRRTPPRPATRRVRRRRDRVARGRCGAGWIAGRRSTGLERRGG